MFLTQASCDGIGGTPDAAAADSALVLAAGPVLAHEAGRKGNVNSATTASGVCMARSRRSNLHLGTTPY